MGGEAGGEQVRSFPCIKLTAGRFIAAILPGYNTGLNVGSRNAAIIVFAASHLTRNKRFRSPFCQRLATTGSALLSSARERLYLPSAKSVLGKMPAGPAWPRSLEARSLSDRRAWEGAAQTPHQLGFSPSARHRCRSSGWKGFGYLPFLPRLISEPERSRHPASSRSVSSFLGNLSLL